MSYPYIVQIAWDAINQFILDWQKQPYKWSTEINIQAEIYSRLSNAYNLIGKSDVTGKYKEAQIWNRVSCEEKINYRSEDGKEYYCFPDLILWDEIKNPDSPPEENWPMLWMCEINASNPEKKDWDLEKMQYLLDQNYVQYALWLNFFHQRAKKEKEITWSKPVKDMELWVCTVRLPLLRYSE